MVELKRPRGDTVRARARADARRRRARLLPAPRDRGGARAAAARSGRCSTSATASRSAAQRARWAVGFQNERVTRRGARDRAPLRPRDDRLHGERRGADRRARPARRQRRLYGLSGSSTGSPGPSSGRLISFAPSDGIARDDLSSDRQRRGARRRHVGDQARPGCRSPSPASPARGTSASAPRRRTSSAPAPFVVRFELERLGPDQNEHALAVLPAARRVDLQPHADVLHLARRADRPRPTRAGSSSR